MIKYKGVEIPYKLLEGAVGEKIASLFINKEFEDLAAIDAFCGRTKGIGPKTQKSFHLLVAKVMEIHNNQQKKEQKVESKKEFVLPPVLKAIGYLKASKPENQQMFEDLASGIMREETPTSKLFRIRPEVYNKYKTSTSNPGRQMLKYIEKRLGQRGHKTAWNKNWLVIYNK